VAVVTAPNSTKDVPSALMRQTLLDPERLAAAEPGREQTPRRLLPWLDVVVLGGTSIVDRGGDVLLGVVEELRSNFSTAAPADGGRLLVLTGAGVRARHVLGVGLDLGLPAGALAGLAAVEAEQNGHLVAALLAADGVSYLPHGTVARQLPVHLAAAPAAVSTGYPPYGVHEFPAAGGGRLPVHRTDAGALLLADAFGARSLTYLRDTEALVGVEGASLTVADAADHDGPLPLDRVVLDLLPRAKHVRSLAVVDGTVRGRLTHPHARRGSRFTLRAG
jgi:molybdenum storage protein